MTGIITLSWEETHMSSLIPKKYPIHIDWPVYLKAMVYPFIFLLFTSLLHLPVNHLPLWSMEAYALPVEKDDVETVAVNFMRSKMGKSTVEPSIKSEIDLSHYEITDQVYGFIMDPTGFVFVSGDDQVKPIIGYSVKSSISTEDLPTNLIYFLKTISDSVDCVRDKTLKNKLDKNGFSGEWGRLLLSGDVNTATEKTNKDVTIGPLLGSIKWGQGIPYNYLMPTVKNQSSCDTSKCMKYPAGCVAIAMAQIMKYYEWPKKSENEWHKGPYTTTCGDKTEAVGMGENEAYNWANIPNTITKRSYYSDYTDPTELAQMLNTSKLIFQVGALINTDYGGFGKVTCGTESGSGAYISDLPSVMDDYFDYNVCEYKDFGDNSGWPYVFSEIKQNRPVIFGGHDTTRGGHAWVIDGYNYSDVTFWCNWGWYGSGNGWFTLFFLCPDGGGCYKNSQDVLMKICPNECEDDGTLANTGFLRWNITPAEVVTAGAKWRIKDGVWRDTGYVEILNSSDNKTIEYSTIDGWVTPSNNTLFVKSGILTEATGTYTRIPAQTGSLTVTITPAAAVTAGAQWRITGTTTWRNNGYTETGLPVGTKTVEFKSVTGYTTPTNKTVNITAGSTATTTGEYVPVTTTGSLTVTITPAAAVTAGAQWRITGTSAWRNSGYTETGLSVGAKTIEFKTITGWTAPGNTTANITSGGVAKASGVYTPISVSTGQLVVNIAFESQPSRYNEEEAYWKIDSGAWLVGGVTQTVSTGKHTVSFKNLKCYGSPDSLEVNIQKDTLSTFTKTYSLLNLGNWRSDVNQDGIVDNNDIIMIYDRLHKGSPLNCD